MKVKVQLFFKSKIIIFWRKKKQKKKNLVDETIGILQKSSRVTIPRGRSQIKRIDTINVEENEEGFEADAIEEKIKVGEREVVVKRGMEGGYLNISRVRDANQKEYSQSVVQDISFHHSGKIILTAGFDKTLRIFQVYFDQDILKKNFFFNNWNFFL